MYSVSDETRKPIFEGVQGENEAREIQFDVTAWVEELGEGACTATAKRPTDTTPYPVTVTRSGNVVTWKPNSADTSIEGIGAFQLAFSINDVVAKTRIWNTKIAPSLVGAGNPPDPYDDWIQDLRDIAAETLTYSQNAEDSAEDAEAWAVGQRGGVDVPSTDPTYHNNSKYWAEQSLANQYGAFIVKSASGDIASFADGADDVPMKSLKVTITPKQSGSGDPSPSNVRPITGTSTANVTVKGKNLYNPAVQHLNANYVTLNGDTFTMTWDDGGVKIYGKWGTLLQGFPKGRYTLQFIGTNVTYLRAQLMRVSNDTSIMSVSNGQTFTVDEDFYINIYGSYAHPDTAVFKVQLETGETTTAYEPYVGGHNTPVPLGQTVYGGEDEAVSGTLTTTHKMDVFDGSDDENWSWQSSGRARLEIAGIKPSSGRKEVMCNIGVYSATAEDPFTIFQSGAYIYYYPPTSVTSLETFKTWLASNNMQIRYELNTPIVTTHTPVSVPSLLGTNNVWADCGAVEVEYRADPTLAYNELANIIVSLGGNL